MIGYRHVGVALTAITVPAIAACQGGTGDGSARAEERAAAGSSMAASVESQESQLPPSIVGRGGPLRGTNVRYDPDDTTTVGYLSLPEGDGSHPAVILIHEWNGLVDRVRQVADDMATQGYVALAADLYHGRVASSAEESRTLMESTQADPEAIIANLDAAARFLRERPDVTGKVATMGWCFGGGVALSYAIDGEHHDGTAIFYGRLLDDPEKLARIHHPIYGTFGEMDRGIPPETVERFVAALRKAGIENDVHIYDGVGHGFWLWVDRDPEGRAGPALDAWNRLKTYLERVLG